jgi:hypothetical protein
VGRLIRRPARIITALSFGLILSQVAIMAVPAVIVDLASQWSLDAAQIGWLGGIYFAGYAAGFSPAPQTGPTDGRSMQSRRRWRTHQRDSGHSP